MKHATQMQFGRSIEVVLTPETGECIDKWHALNALTDAAEAYGLSHRTLGVLKALMSFLPDRLIHPMPGQAIVFPSNNTLSHRLNGMPNSTLRRHLATLVQLGIVSRFDSPNRKRYARRSATNAIAFGFDLSPIARHFEQLSKQAEDARQTRADLQILRAELGALRDTLLARAGHDSLTEEARMALRRNPNEGDLMHLKGALQTRIDDLTTTELSAPDAQNERHIQVNSQYNSDSELLASKVNLPKKTKPQIVDEANAQKKTSITLHDVTQRCSEFQTYFPDKLFHWADLVTIAERLANMIGIDAPVFRDACKALRPERAAIVVVCLLENLPNIQNPGGYLRRITQSARAGGFDVRPMLYAVGRSRELSADNF